MNNVINIADSSAMGADILRKGALFAGKIHAYFADVSKDGNITAIDVQNLNRYLVTE